VADNKELLLIEIREDGARVVKRRIQDIGTAGDQTTNQMSRLKTVLGGLISAKVLKDTILLADSYATMLNRLRVVTEGNYELHAAMDAVYKMSRDTRSSMEANIDMYSRVAINTKQMGMEMDDVVRFSTQLNHAIILSGVTAREAQWGMVQFSQALASNALRGDELRAVMEQLPIVVDVIKDHFGVSRGELRELGFQGRLTSKELIKAFNEAEKSLADRFAKTIPTVNQAMTVLRSSIIRFVGELDQTYQITPRIAQALLWAADNMDLLGRVAAVAGAVLGTVLLRNLIQVIAQMKLFSTVLLRAHPLAALFLTAAAAIAVYSDKIKIANDSSATLADLMTVLGENAKTLYAALRDSISGIMDAGDLNTEYEVTLSLILQDVASFIDKFIGFFVGAGQVVVAVIQNIPDRAREAWNLMIDGFEWVKDSIVAVFDAIGRAFSVQMQFIKAGLIALSAAVKQAMAGNLTEARRFSDQAALSFKNAARDGFGNFGDHMRNAIEDATAENSMSRFKFKVEKSGETLGEAFMRGFNMSTLVRSGVDDLLGRADKLAESRNTGGPVGGNEGRWSPTPVQSQLIKEMTGDAGRLIGEVQALNDLWTEMSQRPEDKRIIDFDQYTLKMRELKYEMLETSTVAVDGIERGFLKAGMTISDFASTAEDVVVNAFDNMTSALANFVATGKMDWKSFVSSLIADLSRLLAQMMLMKAFQALGNAIGGPLGKAFGTLGSQMGGKALGGHVTPAMPVVVGERGPEVFQPASPGTIIPNNQISGPQSGSGEANQQNINVIVVDSMEKAYAAMRSSEGQNIIVNTMETKKSNAR